MTLAERTADLLREFGLEPDFLGGAGDPMPSRSPIDASLLPSVRSHTDARWQKRWPQRLLPSRSGA
jgi:hypothetical protein